MVLKYAKPYYYVETIIEKVKIEMKLEILSDDRILIIFENDSPLRSLFEGLIIGLNNNKIYRRWMNNLNNKNYLKTLDLMESTPLFFKYLSKIIKSLREQDCPIPLWLIKEMILYELK